MHLPAEISYDLIMGDDMRFVEGAFRLPGESWQVFVVSRCDVSMPQVILQRWESGASGVKIQFPRIGRLDRNEV